MLIILQTRGLLTRPWCLFEIFSAIQASIPIVAVNIQGGAFPYDFQEAAELLRTLSKKDGTLAKKNPAALTLLEAESVDVIELGRVLAATIPNLISQPFNPSGSGRILAAQIQDIAENMMTVVSNPAMTITTETKTTVTVHAAVDVENGSGGSSSSLLRADSGRRR